MSCRLLRPAGVLHVQQGPREEQATRRAGDAGQASLAGGWPQRAESHRHRQRGMKGGLEIARYPAAKFVTKFWLMSHILNLQH